jgi:acetone carboxylase alpha subunit
VLPRFAEKVYGAVIQQDDSGFWRVDADATEKRRGEIREERGRSAVPVREFLAAEREKILARDVDPALKRCYDESLDYSARWKDWFRSFWDLPDDFHFEQG